MLVHICCSVDSHYFLSELRKAYPQESFVGFFYNPNIHPKAEYDLRLSDVRRSCNMLKIPLIEGDYELESWLDSVKGQEHEPEKGARCSTCFDVRLEKSAQIAKELGERIFTTTLLSSPMKEQEILYQQGDIIAQGYGLDFVKINVRKNGGVQKQNELAKRDNLYRQNYCGCQFALSKQRAKQDRLSLEMISEIGGRALPGSIEERQKSFALRNTLESNGKTYILAQRKQRVWRLLWGKISSSTPASDSHNALLDRVVVNSYILAHSESKKSKANVITWRDVPLRALADSSGVNLDGADFVSKAFCPKPYAESTATLYLESLSLSQNPQQHDERIRLGFCSKDDSILLCLEDFNTLMHTQFANVLELVHNPVDYALELWLRNLLCGSESINPIIIVDSGHSWEKIDIEIEAIFQDEKTFNTIPIL